MHHAVCVVHGVCRLQGKMKMPALQACAHPPSSSLTLPARSFTSSAVKSCLELPDRSVTLVLEREQARGEGGEEGLAPPGEADGAPPLFDPKLFE